MLCTMSGLLLAQQPGPWRDPSPHKGQFVTVSQGVSLEVLDWGGSGRPIVLLSGLGNTAHAFDDFAPKLTSSNHVYGITRRGFGASIVPAAGYDADTLGNDVLAVLDSLKLNKPVLAGESLGGEELSSVGSRYPDRVSGLVYLDAAYQYAFDNGRGSTLSELQDNSPQPPQPARADLASFAAYEAYFKRVAGVSVPEAEVRQMMSETKDGKVGSPRTPPWVGQQVLTGMKKYSSIPVRALAIYAVPHDIGTWLEDPKEAAEFSVRETAWVEKQAKAFEQGVPTARVVRLPHASHLVFVSNEADVLREMRSFLAGLN